MPNGVIVAGVEVAAVAAFITVVVWITRARRKQDDREPLEPTEYSSTQDD